MQTVRPNAVRAVKMILKDFLLQPLAILDYYVVHIDALNPKFFMLNFTMGFKNVLIYSNMSKKSLPPIAQILL